MQILNEIRQSELREIMIFLQKDHVPIRDKLQLPYNSYSIGRVGGRILSTRSELQAVAEKQ